ncbi:MAG TPA: arsenosugar biosynthesis radical SAM (seleno)protein ArsS [Thermoanaerobaculia bacterium]|nr:arsenosugar biosynthesis radical SAM (seleno)protein ArsS [Thermoanaerobaculia bacterium]
MTTFPSKAPDEEGGRGESLPGPKSTKSLRARHSPLAAPSAQLAQLEALVIEGTSLDFESALASAGTSGLHPAPLEVFQINLGKLCNMTCRHCHVDAGPDRWDAMMTRETIEACFRALDQTSATTVDLTGGAPELHPDFRTVVEQAVARGKHVIDRCNLSVLLLPRTAGLAEWLGERGVEIVASLPHYRKRNTDAQRGDGAFEKSIEALRLLNAAGYGKGDPRRVLTLMSNPAGAFLAATQHSVESEWKAALKRDWDITFDRLFALNNMPISRFLEWLVESDNLEAYMAKLGQSFNPAAIAGLMCRNTISISWDGRLFDCDFNQMLELDALPGDAAITVHDFDFESWQKRRIVTRRHCFGCTAGAGSSCAGATT